MMAAAETGMVAIFKIYGAWILGGIAAIFGYGKLNAKVEANREAIAAQAINMQKLEARTEVREQRWKQQNDIALSKIHDKIDDNKDAVNLLRLDILTAINDIRKSK